MDKILPALIISALSGISFIAYKHPKGYATLYSALESIVFSAMLAIGAWQTCLMTITPIVRPYVASSKRAEMLEKLDAEYASWWLIGSTACVYIYLLFLRRCLPLLCEEEPVQKEGDAE